MAYKIVVLAKQVPDTSNITGKAMTDEGTVNRAALPTIYNPEDLLALEMALDIKDRFGAVITVITMGPPKAADILRASLYKGADKGILLSDRALAASDTLPTSLALAHAIKANGPFDFVFCGRQAIDGDTAQVGPQCADKLGVNQLTYVTTIRDIRDGIVECTRLIGNGVETVKAALPLLMTVPDGAAEPRPSNAKRLMKFKKAKTAFEIEEALKTGDAYLDEPIEAALKQKTEEYKTKGLLLTTYGIADIGLDKADVGLQGSPTMVKKVENVVLAGGAHKKIEPTLSEINALVHELIEDHTLG